jgi:hypothetical protein
MSVAGDLAARKALLTAQADLSRVQLTLAWTDLRNVVSPPATGERSSGVRRTAAFLVAAALPLLGRTRLGRLLRYASFALAGLRLLSNWRAR